MVQSLFKSTTYGTEDSAPALHTQFHLGTIMNIIFHPFTTASISMPLLINSFFQLIFLLTTSTHQLSLLISLFIVANIMIVMTLIVAAGMQVYGKVREMAEHKKRYREWSSEVVVVTGGSSGLGLELVRRLSKKGAKVAILDISPPPSSLSSEINVSSTTSNDSLNEQAVNFYMCDISNFDHVDSTIDAIEAKFGRVTILVNNAGICRANSLLASSEADIRMTFNVNSLAHFWTTKRVLKGMQESKYGHIVTIASTMGLSGVAEMTHYCASKFAAVGFHESLRQELYKLPFNHLIHSTLICPGLILTGMFNGISIRFPFIIPPLTPKQVADQVMDALENTVYVSPAENIQKKKFSISDYSRLHKVIWTPKTYYLPAIMNICFPVWLNDTVKQIMGANNAINENFVGREKKDY